MRLRTIKLSVRYFWTKRKPKAIRKPRKKNIPYVGEVNIIIVKYLKNICNIAGVLAEVASQAHNLKVESLPLLVIN